MHILVVDDDQAVRDSLKRSLEYNGYEVRAAEDGVQALARLAATRWSSVSAHGAITVETRQKGARTVPRKHRCRPGSWEAGLTAAGAGVGGVPGGDLGLDKGAENSSG